MQWNKRYSIKEVNTESTRSKVWCQCQEELHETIDEKIAHHVSGGWATLQFLRWDLNPKTTKDLVSK